MSDPTAAEWLAMSRAERKALTPDQHETIAAEFTRQHTPLGTLTGWHVSVSKGQMVVFGKISGHASIPDGTPHISPPLKAVWDGVAVLTDNYRYTLAMETTPQ